MNSTRPDPDALLRRVQEESAREKRATLKIFFGFAPGVGKTFAMLESAQRLKERGVDVVVGCVETHGRADTVALVDGLEILPRRRHVYKTAELEEFDLDAALKRKPAVLLLDELAHTNAQGSRHAKRYQDVLELLDAGIDVHTALNVQHVESLNDTVAQITGVRVRETVPDALLERADEIELIDLPPEELLERLAAGKVYMAEQAARATENFFRQGNLLSLRELALRSVADRVDADVRAYREIHSIREIAPASEHVLVCVGAAPASAQLVRAAKRIANGLHCPWTAAVVESIVRKPLSEADRQRRDAHLALAEQLGAEVVRLSGEDVADALLDFARVRNVTRIVIGKPTHSRLRDMAFGSLLDDVVRGSGEIEVHVISGLSSPERVELHAPEPAARTHWVQFAASALAVALVTTFCALLRDSFEPTDVVVLYLVSIVAVAARFGHRPSLFASALSVGAYDFFFVTPYYTFAVSDVRHVLTFAMMFGASIAVSTFMHRLRSQEHAAKTREARTATLYAFSRALGATQSEAEAAEALYRNVSMALGAKASVVFGIGDALTTIGDLSLSPGDQAVARWVIDHGRQAGRHTDTLPGSAVFALPIEISEGMRSALVIDGAHALEAEQRDLVQAFARQAAIAIARARLVDRVDSALLRARTEEIRSSLLSAVSHDLRTPLASITGAASTLLDESTALQSEQKQELLASICDEAKRLESLVANLLEMTKIESGAIVLQREWVPTEEVIGSAVTRTEAATSGRDVLVDVPPNVSIHVDPVLFEHVIVNLIDNATKHTPSGSPINIRVRTTPAEVLIEVSDRGPGIPPEERVRIFEKFVRLAGGSRGGSGLGLAICKGIVEAHHGSIHVAAREGGGSVFTIELPREESPQ